jgi:hypothetical protein
VASLNHIRPPEGIPFRFLPVGIRSKGGKRPRLAIGLRREEVAILSTEEEHEAEQDAQQPFVETLAPARGESLDGPSAPARGGDQGKENLLAFRNRAAALIRFVLQ